MLRLTALSIAGLCLAPLLLVLSAWLMPLSPETAEVWRHMKATLLGEYMWQTVWLCLGVGGVCALFGVAAAWVLSQFSFAGRAWLEWGMILPLAMPAYISAYAYGWLFEYGGPVQAGLRELLHLARHDYYFPPIRSLGGAIWILGMATVPYVYLLARAAFLSQPKEWWEAAATLGASSGRFFRTVALPAARPFLATGVALALMETIADIGTVTVFGVNSLSAGIYRSWFFAGEPLLAARLAGFLLLFVCVLMGLEAFGRLSMRYSSLRHHARRERIALSKGRAATAFMICFTPVCAGFLLPLAVLLRLAAYADLSAVSLGDYFWQTVRLAVLTGIVACIAAFCMVCAERFHHRWLRFITLFSNLGYAIPGSVVAVGLMLLFGWWHRYSGFDWAVTGSILGLLIAYIVRFMATSYSPLHSGMLRIPAELDMASASLGKNRAATLLRVHLPLLALPLCVAFLLVFLDTVKELPATLILRPFDVKTLAIRAYEFASDDRQVEAAPYSLLLIALSTLAVVLLHGLQKRMQRWDHV